MQKWISFLVFVCLTSSVLGCSGRITTRTEIIKIYPPDNLLVATPVPRRPHIADNATVGDLVEYYESYISDLIGAINQCNADKEAVKEF